MPRKLYFRWHKPRQTVIRKMNGMLYTNTKTLKKKCAPRKKRKKNRNKGRYAGSERLPVFDVTKDVSRILRVYASQHGRLWMNGSNGPQWNSDETERKPEPKENKHSGGRRGIFPSSILRTQRDAAQPLIRAASACHVKRVRTQLGRSHYRIVHIFPRMAHSTYVPRK